MERATSATQGLESPSTRPAEQSPRLYVERRSTRRSALETPTPKAADRRTEWWVAPLAGLAFVIAVLVVVGPLTAAICALAVAVAQAAALAGIGRRAEQLDELAHTDHLTGLSNSRALWRDLDAMLAEQPVGLIIADLDRFKRVNDEYGHAIGDLVLTAFGRLLPGLVGPDDRCYRYGGEEFVILLPGAREQAAAAVAERVRARTARGFGDGLPRLTLSAGVAAASAGSRGHRLLDRADGALRRAKVGGRDRVVRAGLIDHRQAAEDDATFAARRAALAIASAALEATDPETADHSDEVVLLCEAIADRLGIHGTEREHLLIAARLHDVGKVAVPREILLKPAALDKQEQEIMRRHTITGEQILRAVPELEPIAPLVRSAHERYDGKGYPDGLAGEEIPLGSRVILCADAFHAIRSDRPYRAGRPSDVATRELAAHAGTQFDPLVAAALLDVVRQAGTPAAHPRRYATGSPRLMALLLALTVAGTAVASVPALRHELRALVSPPHHRAVHSVSRPTASAVTCPELALQGAGCRGAGVLLPLTLPAQAAAPAVSATATHARRGLGHGAPATRGGNSAASTQPGSTATAAPTSAAPSASSSAGKSSSAPRRTGTAPGRSHRAPGRSHTTPGQSHTTPGRSHTTPGQSHTTPAHGGVAPGQSHSTPGQSHSTPGQSHTTPTPSKPTTGSGSVNSKPAPATVTGSGGSVPAGGSSHAKGSPGAGNTAPPSSG